MFTDGRTDRRTDGRTDGRTDARLIAISPEPFGRGIKIAIRGDGKSPDRRPPWALVKRVHFKTHISNILSFFYASD